MNPAPPVTRTRLLRAATLYSSPDVEGREHARGHDGRVVGKVEQEVEHVECCHRHSLLCLSSTLENSPHRLPHPHHLDTMLVHSPD